MLRCGLWGARADNGGLAALTHDFWRHIRPERTMVIDLGTAGRGPSHNERYPDAEVNHGYNDDIAESAVRRFLHGLDVVYCVDEETEALTRRGWLRYNQIKLDDEMLTLRASDHLAEWQPVLAVNIFPSRPRRMLSIESRGHSSLTTEDHRWLVQHQMSGIRPEHVRKENRVVTSRDLRNADRIPRCAPCINLPTETKYSDALVELVGWFYTEGHIHGNVGIGITQSQRVNAAHCSRIRACLTELFGTAREAFTRHGRNWSGIPQWRETSRSDGLTVWYLNADAAEVVLTLAPNKIVKREFIQCLTRSQLELFIQVSMWADNAGPRAFAQRNSARLEGFELANILLGRGIARRLTQGMWTTSLYKSRYMYLDMVGRYERLSRREWVNHHGIVWCPSTPNGSWFARRHGTMYFTGNCAETAYYEPFCDIARELGVRTVLHAMPELYRAGDAQPDAVWVPTSWGRGRVDHPNVRVMPVPVCRDTFADRAAHRPVDTFLHMGAPAFHDRNGTLSLIEALVHVRRAVKIVFATADKPPPIRNLHGARVEIDWRPGSSVDRVDAYPADCEALVLPRRYGGLSLPFQEAAALGWPVVATDLEPQNQWLAACTLVRVSPWRTAAMVAGEFQMYSADPGHLARVIDVLGGDQAAVDEAREASRARAATLDWAEWAPRYWDAFEEIVEKMPVRS